MKRLLLDINVLLDILLDRQPHVAASSSVWTHIEKGEVVGYVPAQGLTTIHYLVARERGAPIAREAVEAIVQVLEVAPVDAAVVRRAIRLAWPDFEDAVCAASALAMECDAIVTRDLLGFPSSPIPVMDPETALGWLEGAGKP